MADALSVIPAAVLRNLSDKLYEKRKNAALEVHKLHMRIIILVLLGICFRSYCCLFSLFLIFFPFLRVCLDLGGRDSETISDGG